MANNTYMKYSILLMLLGGAFKLQTRSAIKRKLFQAWRIMLNSSIFYVIVAFYVDLVQKGTEDFDAVVMNLVYIFVTLIVSVKANYYYLFDGKTEGIVKEMHRLFKYRTKTLLQEKDLRTSINLGRNITTFWFTTSTVACQGYILMSLFFNRGLERKLPLPLWFPYNWKISPLYELTILYQLFIHQIIVFIVVGTDMFYASVVMLTSDQFTLLGWEIKHSLYTVLLENGVSKKTVSSVQAFINDKLKESIDRDVIGVEFLNELLTLQPIKADLLQNLNQLIQFHQALVKFCNRLEEFFSMMYLPYVFIILIIDVFVCFIITTTKDATIMVTGALYMISDMVTLLLGCYFGNLLSTRAENLQCDVYNSPWYVCDVKYRSHIKLLHWKTCKPIVLTVGKIAPLSLTTFLWVLKNIVSYGMVLYQLVEENR